ncbi:MAG: hypothetical protein K8U03_16380 [Planctomycetia bacterium]|nr:hypothetical protein [Planctomycetia bacterium]
MTRIDADQDPEEPDVAPYQPQLISGKWVMIVVAAVSFFGAAFGWLWIYDAQRRPRDFWGPRSWKLMGLAPVVRARSLMPELPAADGKPHPDDYDGLVVVHYDPGEAARFVVEQEKRVENEPGLSIATQSASLREALTNHRSYNWDSKAAALQRPKWRYALLFSERTEAEVAKPEELTSGKPLGNPTATLLFDADCRFVRLPLVDKAISLQPSIAEQFRKFFRTQFPEGDAKPQAIGTAVPAATPAMSVGTGS